jgi:hypothetical protein
MNTTFTSTLARRALCGGLFALCASALRSSAQTTVTAHIDADKPINVMTTEAMGVYTVLYDGDSTKPIVAQYLHAAGIYTIQYPGGTNDSGTPTYPDLYHWSTGSGSKYMNVSPQPGFFYPSETDMAHITNFLDKLGTAVITVNYGSNLAGTGGGEPAEAAAWVAYANGDPSSTQVIGKDSTGQDWKTVGYWASLRAAAPLATDDGQNKLRANHPKPLGIQLWQIGSEVYNNGFYGGDHKGEEDLHAPYPPTEKENEKRKGNPNLSPAFYGERVVEFSKAMKAVDPKIWIGAKLVLGPDAYSWAPDWNRDVLKAACSSIDFESLTWRADARISVDPYNVMDEAATLQLPEKQLGPIFGEVIYNNKKFCPASHQPRVAFTQMAPIEWAKVGNPMVYGLFAADAFALLAESGVINSDWVELHHPSFLTGSNTPGPGYYGAQMLHIVAFRPGDQFVTTTSSSSTLAVHATHRTDGALGILLINKDNSAAATVKISIGGGTFATQGTRFDYGQDNLKVLSAVTKTPIKVDGSTFTVTVAPYTITDIVLPKAQ